MFSFISFCNEIGIQDYLRVCVFVFVVVEVECFGFGIFLFCKIQIVFYFDFLIGKNNWYILSQLNVNGYLSLMIKFFVDCDLE